MSAFCTDIMLSADGTTDQQQCQ